MWRVTTICVFKQTRKGHNFSSENLDENCHFYSRSNGSILFWNQRSESVNDHVELMCRTWGRIRAARAPSRLSNRFLLERKQFRGLNRIVMRLKSWHAQLQRTTEGVESTGFVLSRLNIKLDGCVWRKNPQHFFFS